jgi:iron complex outermembrane receptor protein
MAAKNAQFPINSKFTRTSEKTDVCRPERTVLASAISAALIAGVASGPALAQEPELEEIVVTATRRQESVMDVPLAITALSGDFIRETNLNDIKDLIAFTPGITGNSQDSFLDFVSVRGIRTIDFGNGGDPSVSLFKNGLYQGRTGSGVSSLFDIERAEVLRGPQGFLFGRNSVSGGMNVITTKANVDQTEGFAELDVGERDRIAFEGAVNFPMSDTFALRLAAYHSEEDGWVENLAGGPDLIAHDKTAGRLSARYQTDKWTTDFMVEYEDRDQSGTIYRQTGRGSSFDEQIRVNGGVAPEVSPDGRVVNNENNLTPIDIAEILSTGLFIEYDMEWGTFSSNTGFKDYDYSYVEDFDGSPLELFTYGQDQEGDYFEQEFRITSTNDGPLSWYAGVSYYKENVDTTFFGLQSEDVYCATYWSYYGYYYQHANCQEVWDYYNYLGAPDVYHPDDAYYRGAYPYDYCCYMNAYYLQYYFGTYTWDPTQNPSGMMLDRNRVIGEYQGYSGYVDLSYRFNDTFDVDLGVRYSYDEKKFSQEVLEDPNNSILKYKVQTGFSTPNGPLTDKQDWDEVTWRVVANWRPNDSTLLFGSVTTGYKPGGFGSFNVEGPSCVGPVEPIRWGLCETTPGVDRPGDFGPETVISYEIGYKGTLLDGRAQVSANAFFYDYEDMQAIFEIGPRVVVDNIGQVDGTGVEVDVSMALTDNFRLRVGGSWFDSEATNVQAFCGNGELLTGDENACEGNSIPWAPEFTALAVLNANFPTGNGEFFGNLSWTWEDDYRGDWPDPSVIFQRIPAINQTDIVVGFRRDNWRISAYVENVFDQLWYDGNYANDDPRNISVDEDGLRDDVNPYTEHVFGPARPTTVGVRFGYSF